MAGTTGWRPGARADRGNCSTQSRLGVQVLFHQRLAPLSCLSSSQGKDGGQVGSTVPPRPSPHIRPQPEEPALD